MRAEIYNASSRQGLYSHWNHISFQDQAILPDCLKTALLNSLRQKMQSDQYLTHDFFDTEMSLY